MISYQGPQEGAAHLVLETIFSPVFHSARNGDRELADEGRWKNYISSVT